MKSIKIINPSFRAITKTLSKVLSKHTTSSVCSKAMNINPTDGSLTVLDGKVLLTIENLEEIKDIDIIKTWDTEEESIPVEIEETKTGVYLTPLDGKFPDYKKIIRKKTNDKEMECNLFAEKESGFSIFYSSIIAEQALHIGKATSFFKVDYLKLVYKLMIECNVESFKLKLSDIDSDFSGIQIEASLYGAYPMYFIVMPILLTKSVKEEN